MAAVVPESTMPPVLFPCTLVFLRRWTLCVAAFHLRPDMFGLESRSERAILVRTNCVVAILLSRMEVRCPVRRDSCRSLLYSVPADTILVHYWRCGFIHGLLLAL